MDEILKLQRKIMKGFTGTAFMYAQYLSPSSTLVINLTSARNCPCRRGDKCIDGGICTSRMYEMMDSSLYQKDITVENFLKHSKTSDIILLIEAYIENSLQPITHIRLDGAGDFNNQKEIIRWDNIAQHFWETRNIVTYTYSKRNDLDFSVVNYLVVNNDMNNVSDALYKCMPNMYGNTFI